MKVTEKSSGLGKCLIFPLRNLAERIYPGVQREWLRGQLHLSKPNIICSGSVMTRSSESWDQYLDFAWLLAQPAQQMIVLTGDIHKNVPPNRHARNVYEITSSGAARC
jgi:hypothetical protein